MAERVPNNVQDLLRDNEACSTSAILGVLDCFLNEEAPLYQRMSVLKDGGPAQF